MLDAFVINRLADADRRASILRSIAQDGTLRPRLIEAVDGYGPSFVPPSDLPIRRGAGTPGNIGCSLSHRLAWKEVVATGLKWALILEDDALVMAGFATLVEDLESLGPFDLVFVNSRCVRYRTLLNDGDRSKFRRVEEVYRLLRIHLGDKAEHRTRGGLLSAPGGDGYVISRSGAEKLLTFIAEDGIGGAIDFYMFYKCLDEDTLRAVTPTTKISERIDLFGINRKTVSGFIYDRALVRTDGAFPSVREIRSVAQAREPGS